MIKKEASQSVMDKIKKANEEATDWHATCRICHTELVGTLKQIREHVCDVHPR